MMWGTTRALVAYMVKGVSDRLHASRWRSPAPAIRAAVQGERWRSTSASRIRCVYPMPEGHQDHLRAADRDQGGRCGQAPGRPGGGGNPRVPPAGALQGQGRALQRRADPPQGRQEEVTMMVGYSHLMSLRAQRRPSIREWSCPGRRGSRRRCAPRHDSPASTEASRMSAHQDLRDRRRAAPALPVAPQVGRAAAAVGVPLGQEHLRPGDRRQRRAARWRPRRRSTRRCARR